MEKGISVEDLKAVLGDCTSEGGQTKALAARITEFNEEASRLRIASFKLLAKAQCFEHLVLELEKYLENLTT